MGAVDRGPELREQLAKVLAKRTLGELYGYDIGPGVVMSPQGPMAGYVVIISTGSPALVPRLAGAHFIGDAWPTEQLLEQAVRECLAQVDRKRPKTAPVASGQRSESGLFHG